MIQATKTYRRIPYSVVWFPEEQDLAQVKRLISVLTVVRQASPGFIHRFQHRIVSSRRYCTATIDLTQSEDALLAGMNTTCRYQIRRGEKLNPEFVVSSPSALPLARQAIDEFSESRFGHPVSAENWQMIERHGSISQVTLGEQVISAHTHIVDGNKRARIYFGTGVSREDNIFAQRTTSILGRVLVWRDLLHYKRLGTHFYDMGGLFDDPEHPAYSIDQYKLTFGAHKVYEHHALTSPYALVRAGLRAAGKSGLQTLGDGS